MKLSPWWFLIIGAVLLYVVYKSSVWPKVTSQLEKLNNLAVNLGPGAQPAPKAQ